MPSALAAQAACQKCWPPPQLMLAEPKRSLAALEESPEPLFPLEKRPRRQSFAIDEEEIEDEIDQARGASFFGCRLEFGK